MLTDYQLQHMKKELDNNGMVATDDLEDARQFCKKHGFDDNSVSLVESRGRFYIERAENSSMVRAWETQHRIYERMN